MSIEEQEWLNEQICKISLSQSEIEHGEEFFNNPTCCVHESIYFLKAKRDKLVEDRKIREKGMQKEREKWDEFEMSCREVVEFDKVVQERRETLTKNFINSIGFGEYADMIISDGFDTIGSICEFLSMWDLEEIGVAKDDAKRMISKINDMCGVVVPGVNSTGVLKKFKVGKKVRFMTIGLPAQSPVETQVEEPMHDDVKYVKKVKFVSPNRKSPGMRAHRLGQSKAHWWRPKHTGTTCYRLRPIKHKVRAARRKTKKLKMWMERKNKFASNDKQGWMRGKIDNAYINQQLLEIRQCWETMRELENSNI